MQDPATGAVLTDFCPKAANARKHAGIDYFPFSLVEMDVEVMQFNQEFHHLMGDIVPSGYTFIAAGVGEMNKIIPRFFDSSTLENVL